MSPLKSILVVAIASSCLFTAITASALSSISSTNSSSTSSSIFQSRQSSVAQSSQTAIFSSQLSSQQAELATNLPNGKKSLKKQLSLDYTHSKFETEISQPQKDAILKALKKWKGELPVNNTFTITSYANLKSDTTDDKNQSKKKIKKTSNAAVVYMWASTPNPKWDNSKSFDPEDYESGDPRFIRTEFNVLLKQDKKNNWSASIERDIEVKTDALELEESPEDTKVMQDLFGTNKADNALTATSEVLLDINPSVALISSSSSISILNSSSQFQSTLAPASNFQPSTSSINSSSNNSKLISFLNAIFGSVKASAGESDYSWPWKNGESWGVNTGYSWHECSGYSYNPENVYTSGCAIDVWPADSNSVVLAPVTATIQRVCNDGTQGFLKIGNMSILHIDASTIIGSNNVTVTKSTQIGKPYQTPVNSRCGSSTGRHLHIKFAVTPMTIDGSTITHNGYLPSSLTSQNTLITDPNINTVLPIQQDYNYALDFECGTNNDTRVYLKTRYNNDCQKMRWNTSNYTITNKYGKCMDAGDINNTSNRWLRFSNCHGQDNQKWLQSSDGRIWSFKRNNAGQVVCLNYNGFYNGSTVDVVPCDYSQNQKFWFDLGIPGQNVPSNTSNYTKYVFRRTGTNQCMDVDNPSSGTNIYTWDCNYSNQNQIFESIGSQYGGNAFRRLNTTKCIDAWSPYNGRVVYAWECSYDASNHNWYYDWNTKLLKQRNTNQCIAKWNPSNGSAINTWECNQYDGNQKWDAIQL